MIRFYYPDGLAKKCGSQIPTGAEIEVIKFLSHRVAIIMYGQETYTTSALCCRKRLIESPNPKKE